MNANPTTPPDNDEPKLRPHVYDGIQEYDQKLPNWWLFTFYIAIAWFVFSWLGYYQFKLISTDREKLDAEMARIEVARNKELESMTDDKLWAMSRDPSVISAGEATYKSICIACHGPDMMGKKTNPLLPGLALVDQEWKYGHNPTDVLKVVRKGSPDVTKGMPAWEPQLGERRVIEAVAFIFSKHQKGEPFTVAPDAPPQTPAAAPYAQTPPIKVTLGAN
jgi:cytochrome c oxidase cbb3-type subunit III